MLPVANNSERCQIPNTCRRDYAISDGGEKTAFPTRKRKRQAAAIPNVSTVHSQTPEYTLSLNQSSRTLSSRLRSLAVGLARWLQLRISSPPLSTR